MQTKHIPVWIAGLVLALTICQSKSVAEKTVPGGWQTAPVTDQGVIAAAAFAVKAEEKALPGTKGEHSARLTLVEILSARQQVVAGMNYWLKLKVKVNGKPREGETVVYRNLTGEYTLTSWTWK